MNLEKIEKDNRLRVLKIIDSVPTKTTPDGWGVSLHYAIGGLLYASFSEIDNDKLLIISSQGTGIFDCSNGEKIYRDDEFDDYDEANLKVQGMNILEDETLNLTGIGGGGMRKSNKFGDHIEIVFPNYPICEVIFCPNYLSYWNTEKKQNLECCKIFRGYELRAYGFSKCGNYLTVCTNSDVIVWKRKN